MTIKAMDDLPWILQLFRKTMLFTYSNGKHQFFKIVALFLNFTSFVLIWKLNYQKKFDIKKGKTDKSRQCMSTTTGKIWKGWSTITGLY